MSIIDIESARRTMSIECKLIKFVAILILLPFLALNTWAQTGDLNNNSSSGHNESQYDAFEVVGKNPVELITLRGFGAEEHYTVTEDGYILQLARMVNPLAKSKKLKRPVLFNHGLIESATIWLMNSKNVRPRRYPSPANDFERFSNESLRNAPMMLANEGYDVWLLSMRGTDFSQRHVNKSATNADFWDYCLDDFAQKDIPASINYIRRLTGANKVGYVGHSQATFSIFGLLSVRPEYADIVEPVAAFAPVTFMHSTVSIARPLFLLANDLPIINIAQAPAPLFSPRIRAGVKNLCDKAKLAFLKTLCLAEEELISGLGQHFKKGFYSQFPYYSSLKVFRHFGQVVKSKRYCMYDYGKEGNLKHYNMSTNPDYEVSRIRSRSISIFWTAFDTLATPEDVKEFVSRLRVPVFRSVFSDERINHMDMIVSDRSHEFNRPLLEIFEHFENRVSTHASNKHLELESKKLDQLNNELTRLSRLRNDIAKLVRLKQIKLNPTKFDTFQPDQFNISNSGPSRSEHLELKSFKLERHENDLTEADNLQHDPLLPTTDTYESNHLEATHEDVEPEDHPRDYYPRDSRHADYSLPGLSIKTRITNHY